MKQLQSVVNDRANWILSTLLLAVLTIADSSANAAVTRITPAGSPLTFQNANFSIFAFQDINGSPLGTPAIVNRNFEFANSIGVTYALGTQLKDFGIGLYANASKATRSTGLEVLYNIPILASTATATVEDFDIEAGKDTFFKPTKVEPSIALLGAGNTIIDTALPTDIFPNLVPVSGQKDVWNINFPGLLGTLGLPDQPITGFLLFADTTRGEQPSSDPYLLVGVGNGTQIPEPSTAVLVTVACALATFFHLRRRSLKG